MIHIHFFIQPQKMNKYLRLLLLVAGLAAISFALPSTVLKFRPQQKQDDIVKILTKQSGHLAGTLNQPIQYFRKLVSRLLYIFVDWSLKFWVHCYEEKKKKIYAQLKPENLIFFVSTPLHLIIRNLNVLVFYSWSCDFSNMEVHFSFWDIF